MRRSGPEWPDSHSLASSDLTVTEAFQKQALKYKGNRMEAFPEEPSTWHGSSSCQPSSLAEGWR